MALIKYFWFVFFVACAPKQGSNTPTELTTNYICKATPSIETKQIPYIENMFFKDDNSLFVTTWKNESNSIFLWQYEVDILSNKVYPQKQLQNSPPLFSLCIDCVITVFSVSPNQKWQLISISNSEGEDGIWLISKESSFQISKQLAYSSLWLWSHDSQFLWYENPVPGVSQQAKGLISVLNNTPQIAYPLLPPTNEGKYYLGTRYAFSPISNILLATYGGEGVIAYKDDNLFTFKPSNGRLELLEKTYFQGVDAVVWDYSLHDFLIIKIIDSELHITEKETGNTYRLTKEALNNTLLGTIPSENSDKPYAIFDYYAISPNRNNLAVGVNGLIYIFNCQS